MSVMLSLSINCNILLMRQTLMMTTLRGPLILQKRFKHKKKWASNRKQKTSSELALEQFDTFYKPVFGKLWSSIRIALLSQRKYCALVNNFNEDKHLRNRLEKLGATDMMTVARQVEITIDNNDTTLDVQSATGESNHINFNEYNDNFRDVQQNKSAVDTLNNFHWHHRSKALSTSTDYHQESSDNLDKSVIEEYDRNLDNFMPVEKVYSKKEMLIQDVIDHSVFEPRVIQAETVVSTEFDLPRNLKVYTFPRGDISDFPVPKPDVNGVIEYYLLDAASLLPVIALDLQLHDTVLDMCAAPGGKSLASLQCAEPCLMTCNDMSNSRLARLKSMLQWYYPDYKDIEFTQRDGRHITEALYSKVLVDVPCNTDRHVLTNNENNLFQPKRVRERLNLPTVQKDLLLAGIRSCKPGGSVLYSTCTLSPAQNDGVIQAAIEEIWQETSIDLVIQDLSWMAEKFDNTFRFFNKCRHGQLVLPNLSSNFGPMYFSKITRLA